MKPAVVLFAIALVGLLLVSACMRQESKVTEPEPLAGAPDTDILADQLPVADAVPLDSADVDLGMAEAKETLEQW